MRLDRFSPGTGLALALGWLAVTFLIPAAQEAVAPAANAQRAPSIHPVGHDLEGLPTSAGPIAAYATALDHPLNRLHALLFFAARTPTEIGASLPAERRRAGESDAQFFTGRWALSNRKGTEIDAHADTSVFGGDVRTSPVEKLSSDAATELRAILGTMATPEQADALVPGALARLSLQWDLLQLWWRFENGDGADAETLAAMARTIRALGLTRQMFEALPSGLEQLDSLAGPAQPGAEAAHDRRRPRVPRGLLAGAKSAWVEVDRDSKPLFQAQRSLCSARAFVKCTDRATGEALVARSTELAAQNKLVEIPRGTEVALLLSMVGLTRELEPVATNVASELRLRLAVAPDVLDPASDTSSRDGWNQWVWLFSRSANFAEKGAAPLRFVPDTAQSLFLEYGSPKYTTYFAQCALCHRTTNAGNQNPSGVNILGRYAEARVLRDPAKRLRDAEREMEPVVARLRARLQLADRPK
jgi:hypothetical protein